MRLWDLFVRFVSPSCMDVDVVSRGCQQKQWLDVSFVQRMLYWKNQSSISCPRVRPCCTGQFFLPGPVAFKHQLEQEKPYVTWAGNVSDGSWKFCWNSWLALICDSWDVWISRKHWIYFVGRNPAPVDTVACLSYYLQGNMHPRWLFGISSINSMTMPSYLRLFCCEVLTDDLHAFLMISMDQISALCACLIGHSN